MKCKYCEIEIENPEIFKIHEDNCLEEQKLNGLIKEEKEEKRLDEMNVKELKELAKEKGIDGYTDMKKEELITALSK